MKFIKTHKRNWERWAVVVGLLFVTAGAFSADVPVPNSSRVPIVGVDPNGVAVPFADSASGALKIICSDGTNSCFAFTNSGTINVPGTVTTIPTGLTLTAVGQMDVTTTAAGLPSNTA